AAPGSGRSTPSPATDRSRPGATGALRPASSEPAGPLEARRPAGPGGASGRVVPAADRFRALVAPRPWLRRRRTVLAVAAGLVAVVLAAVGVLLFVPAFRVDEVQVAGTGYVPAASVEQ